jgi:protein TonB
MLSSKFLAINRHAASLDRLSQHFFAVTLIAAVLLHLVILYLCGFLPKTEVVDVPVHALSIKLSDSDDTPIAELKIAQPVAVANNANVESTVSHLVRDEKEEKTRQQNVAASMDKAMSGLPKTPAQEPAKSVASPNDTPAAPPPAAAPTTAKSASKAVVKGKFSVRAEGTKTAAPVIPVTAHQFVRENQAKETADNTAAATADKAPHDADVVAHYEQLISLWIQKFKIYPIDARSQGMQGETVVRIRLDRQGNIHYYALEHSTGYPVLDHAAIDMIHRANPVPAVPVDYPPGDLMEFLVPVTFHLQP